MNRLNEQTRRKNAEELAAWFNVIIWTFVIFILTVCYAHSEDLPPLPEPLYRYGTPEGTIIDHHGAWCMAFDGEKRLPRWTLAHLTNEGFKGDAKRPSSFLVDESIPKEFRVGGADWADAGFDRGHVQGCGDFGSDELKRSTMRLSNIAPFNRQLNRVGWNQLEQHVRSYIVPGVEGWVHTIPIYMPSYTGQGKSKALRVSYQVIGDHWIAVPTHFSKTLLTVDRRDPKGGPPRIEMRAWIAPNREPAYDQKIEGWATSVDYIERVAGLDLHPLLIESIQTKLEWNQ